MLCDLRDGRLGSGLAWETWIGLADELAGKGYGRRLRVSVLESQVSLSDQANVLAVGG